MPRHAHNRKINAAKVQQLTALGLSDADIAKQQGCHQSSISRFLAKTREHAHQIKRFQTDRSAIFARVQVKALSIQEQIIDGLDGVTDSLSPSAKSGLLFAMNAVLGTNYDKERLETGQSTSNHSVMTTMLGNSVKSLYAKTPTETLVLPRTSRKQTRKQTPEIG